VSAPLSRAADTLARISTRCVPDSFSIALLLTLLTLALGMLAGGATPAQCLAAWGGSVWALLALSMQMCMVIFAGYVLAVSPAVRAALDFVARVPHSPRQAVAFMALASMLLCWLNWGAGLIASAVLVRMLARRHPDADYRLLVAAAYLGLGTTWHAGPSGSVPLLLATPDSFMIRDALIQSPIALAETVFTPANLALMVVVTALLTGFAALLHPEPDRVVRADPEALRALREFEPPQRPAQPTPADRLAHARWPTLVVGALGLLYARQQAASGSFALTLDSVNLIVLSLALVLHPSPASLLKAAEEAARPLHGVVLQFPLYAGIYGIIKDTGLATALADLFLELATARTFPFIVFVYSALLDYFVPSGGAKWATEAVYVIQAGRQLGVSVTDIAMAYAYGDMATNLVQPFWAIPLLGVARLEFRDILGFLILMFLLYTAVVSAFLFL